MSDRPNRLHVELSTYRLAAVRFADEMAKQPKPFDGCILDLVGRQHQARSRKNGTQAFSTVQYKAGATRGKRGVLRVTALVLDFDHQTNDAAEDIRRRLAESGLASVAYSSFSHRKGGEDDYCFRVVLPFSHPIRPDQYEAVWETMNARLGDHADRSARDTSRIWFVASCPSERKDVAWFDSRDGALVDVDAIAAERPRPGPTRTKRQETQPVDDGGPIPEGERNTRLLKLAGAMRRQGAVREAIAAALHETNGARCQPPLEAPEVEGIAESVCTYDPASRLVAANKTDLGNAERFVAFAGGRFRFVHQWDWWLYYDGTHWVRDESGEAIRAVRDTLRTLATQAGAVPDAKSSKALRKHALDSESSGRITAMLGLAQALLPLAPAMLDRDTDVLNCLNGSLDIRAGRLKPHDSADFHSKIVPVAFEPDAACPQWESFLDRILGGQAALKSFLQRAVGYSLTGSVREQCFFLLYGTGANGKSTFIETVRAALGDYATQADFTTFLKKDSDAARNDLARLASARLVAASEADAGRRLDESLVKQLTGGDTICARFLYKEFFDYKPQFKIWLATNHKPTVTGSDLGIWRRIQLIPFKVTIPKDERDRGLPQKLLTELPGILAWAVRGAKEWYENGLGVPEEVRGATETYRDEMDFLRGFLDDLCIVEPGATVTAKELYAAYKTWADSNGELVRSQKSLGMSLEERQFVRSRGTGGVRFWKGLRLRRENETSDDGVTRDAS